MTVVTLIILLVGIGLSIWGFRSNRALPAWFGGALVVLGLWLFFPNFGIASRRALAAAARAFGAWFNAAFSGNVGFSAIGLILLVVGVILLIIAVRGKKKRPWIAAAAAVIIVGVLVTFFPNFGHATFVLLERLWHITVNWFRLASSSHTF